MNSEFRYQAFALTTKALDENKDAWIILSGNGYAPTVIRTEPTWAWNQAHPDCKIGISTFNVCSAVFTVIDVNHFEYESKSFTEVLGMSVLMGKTTEELWEFIGEHSLS